MRRDLLGWAALCSFVILLVFGCGRGDDSASENKLRPAAKPAPDPYHRAAELHGVDAVSCAAIEDSRWGIESAKAAGLWCVGITHTYPDAELMAADTIVTSLDDITPELIRSLT